jgi:hypothetical protein
MIKQGGEECKYAIQKFLLNYSIEHPNAGLRALHLYQAWTEDQAENYSKSAM